jgi:hypothetical protein
MNPNNRGMPVFYPEDKPHYLRPGQIEIEHIKAPAGSGIRVLIKTYLQTDEEAGGRGSKRCMNVTHFEGNAYYHNGVEGKYEHVGECERAPREFAVRTILIKSQSEILDACGDWDYNILAQKTMHDNLEPVVDINGNEVNLEDTRKGYDPDHITHIFDEPHEVRIRNGVTRVICGTTPGRFKSDKPNVPNIPQSFYME